MANAAVKSGNSFTDTSKAEVTRGATFTPRVDIWEGEEELLLFADMPGVTSENVELRFENGELQVIGRCAQRQDSENYLANEYGVGDYYRAFTITEDIDSDKISAELKNGVLVIHLPKAEAVKPKRIQVKGE